MTTSPKPMPADELPAELIAIGKLLDGDGDNRHIGVSRLMRYAIAQHDRAESERSARAEAEREVARLREAIQGLKALPRVALDAATETNSDLLRALDAARVSLNEAERERDEARVRVREGRMLLHRAVKYVREDRAETPGTTRLARLVETVSDYLKRTHNASDILRAEATASPPAAPLPRSRDEG